MGCGASAEPRPLDDKEKQQVCDIACKEMSTITAKFAISYERDKIIVDPPDEMDQFQTNAKQLRDAVKAAGERMPEGLEVADEIDKNVEVLRKQLKEVGKDIVKAKETPIVEIFVEFIDGYEFNDAFNLFRRLDQNGKYSEEIPSYCITEKLTLVMVEPLAKKLLPIVDDEISKHAFTKAWNLSIQQIDMVTQLMEGQAKDLMGKYGPKPVTLDIKIWIVTKTIEHIAVFMAEKEGEVRRTGRPAEFLWLRKMSEASFGYCLHPNLTPKTWILDEIKRKANAK